MTSTKIEVSRSPDLSDLTCVLITANRPQLAAAQLRRLSQVNAQIIVLNGNEEVHPAIAQAIQKIPRVRIFSNESYSARLDYLSEVQTEFTLLINDDHLFLPSGIQKNLVLMKSDSNISLVINPLPRVTVVKNIKVFKMYRYRTGFESTFYSVRRTSSLLNQLRNLKNLSINPSHPLFEVLFDLSNHMKYQPKKVKWPIEFMIHREEELKNRNHATQHKAFSLSDTLQSMISNWYLGGNTDQSRALESLGFKSVQHLRRHLEMSNYEVTVNRTVPQTIFSILLQLENRYLATRQSRKDTISVTDWLRFLFQLGFNYRSLDTFMRSLSSQGVLIDDFDFAYIMDEIPNAV